MFIKKIKPYPTTEIEKIKSEEHLKYGQHYNKEHPKEYHLEDMVTNNLFYTPKNLTNEKNHYL